MTGGANGELGARGAGVNIDSGDVGGAGGDRRGGDVGGPDGAVGGDDVRGAGWHIRGGVGWLVRGVQAVGADRDVVRAGGEGATPRILGVEHGRSVGRQRL